MGEKVCDFLPLVGLMKGRTVAFVVFALLTIALLGFLMKLTANFTNFSFSDMNEAAKNIFGF